MTKNELNLIINGCRRGDRLSQKHLYQNFYKYGMNISHRYARTDAEAEEMLNDAFLRVFSKIDMYNIELTFVTWFHTIVVRSAINYLKKYENQPKTTDIEMAHTTPINEDTFSKMSSDEIIALVRELPPSYRAAFNLSVIEGHTHNEIAVMMGITEGTARSNLMIARQKLQNMVLQTNKIIKYG